MGKTKKKRNKKYAGRDAKITNVSVRKIEAVNRNPISQWFFDHKKIIKRVILVVVVGGIFIFIMIQAFSALINTR